MTESTELFGAIWPTAKAGRPPLTVAAGLYVATGQAPGLHAVVQLEPPAAATARLLVGTGPDWRSSRCERDAPPRY